MIFDSPCHSDLEDEVDRNTSKPSEVKGLTRDTRRTVDLVLDPRSMSFLAQLRKRGSIGELEYCISTGKEANVYLSKTAVGSLVAVKVFKTSILVFKDRSAYVQGEFRFEKGYASTNPRKMVARWVEKEHRNLMRCAAAGLRVPAVVDRKENILVLKLIARRNDGSESTTDSELLSMVPARRLKDEFPTQLIDRRAANGESSEPVCVWWLKAYQEIGMMMRLMRSGANLVHGDLSEYNILMDESGVSYIIDVSQSVELDHHLAEEFLRRDCVNVNRFFAKFRPGKCHDEGCFSCSSKLDYRTLFAYVVSNSSKSPTSGEDELRNFASIAPVACHSREDITEDEFCAASHELAVGSLTEEACFSSQTQLQLLRGLDSGVTTGEGSECDSEYSENDGISNDEGDDSASGDDSERQSEPRGNRPESASREDEKASRKANKKAVKEENRQKRMNKVPKHLKAKRNENRSRPASRPINPDGGIGVVRAPKVANHGSESNDLQ